MEAREIITVTLVLTLLCSSLPAIGTAQPAESEPTISINAPQTINSGESTRVEVQMSSSTPVYAVQFTINYGGEPIQASALSKGSYLGSQTISVANEITATSVEFGQTRINTQEGVNGTGTVASFTVSVPDNPNTDSFKLIFTTAKVAGPDAKPIPVTTKNLTVQIASSASQQDTTDGGNTGDQTTATTTITESQNHGTTSDSTGSAKTTATTTSIQIENAVQDVLATAETAQVRIELAESQTLTSMVPALEQAGARNISTQNGAIIATISNQSLQKVEQMSGIRSITYAGASNASSTADDSTEEQSADSESASTPMAGTNSSKSSPENESTQNVTTPGFTLSTALLALLSVTLLSRFWNRR